jgi:serine/threonine protein kinase
MTGTVTRFNGVLASRYRIERELGQGGMATVYLAEDLKHHRQVAVKVLRPELTASLGAERFLREIRTNANLRHPHILPLYDSGDVADPADAGGRFHCYVMPYVEGDSLRDRLTHERQLPIDDALRIAREVSDALSYAHARGVIHATSSPRSRLRSGPGVVHEADRGTPVTSPSEADPIAFHSPRPSSRAAGRISGTATVAQPNAEGRDVPVVAVE